MTFEDEGNSSAWPRTLGSRLCGRKFLFDFAALKARSAIIARGQLSWRLKVVVAALIIIAGLLFDAATPQMLSAGTFYAGLVLIGAWFPHPRAALVLATIATPLIIVGYWVATPDDAPAWEVWLNRALEIATVWMAGISVWRIRVLDQRLQAQVDLVRALSQEMNHRVGNQLQFVASFFRLDSGNASAESQRRPSSQRSIGSRGRFS